MRIELKKYPSAEDLLWMKECTVGTDGKEVKTAPNSDWIHRLLTARHSPIRELNFRFVLRDIPYWVSVHLVRSHVGVNFYVQSQRNDRQSNYDRNAARQDAPITMRMSINGEALMTLANKRLCNKAAEETRNVVAEMCRLVIEKVPEFKGLLVPACVYNGKCHEMYPCYKEVLNIENDSERNVQETANNNT